MPHEDLGQAVGQKRNIATLFFEHFYKVLSEILQEG